MLASMADDPIVFAMANPDPEILPEVAGEVRGDVIMATGRSDFPNQVNNVLGFPFIFRGALDVRASDINSAMKIAAAEALAALAREEVPGYILEFIIVTLECALVIGCPVGPVIGSPGINSSESDITV